MDDANEYRTRDFYIAAYLLTHGHKIAYLDKTNPRRVFFVFDDFEGREDFLRSFLYGKGVVEPQAFIASVKTLKGLIHSYD